MRSATIDLQISSAPVIAIAWQSASAGAKNFLLLFKSTSATKCQRTFSAALYLLWIPKFFIRNFIPFIWCS
jgi:hypothetical protein